MAASAQSVEIALEFPSLEFDVLPKVSLVDRQRDVPDMVTHVDQKDGLCYALQGSVLLDRYTPPESALAVIEMVRRTIDRSLSADARGDIRAECPQHWLADATLYVAPGPEAVPGPAELFTVARGWWVPILVLARDLKWLVSFPSTTKGRRFPPGVIDRRFPPGFPRLNRR